jgi:hypothetical protein
MNILIVESENDQYFIQALANFLNTKTTVCKIDDYRHSSLDETKLKTQIGSALTTKGISKIGVILDMDDSTIENRIKLINDCLINALKDNFDNDFKISKQLEKPNEFISVEIDKLTTIGFACYFTNVDGNGELETILKAIKNQDSNFADCILEGWHDCIVSKGKKVVKRGESGDITDKELLKLWVDFYKRFDTLKKGNRNKDTTDWKTIWLGRTNDKGEFIAPPRGRDIFSLESNILDDLKAFLALFS